MRPIVQRSHFEVSFLDDNDQPIQDLKPIEKFVLAADLGTELLVPEGMSHRTNTLIIWLADDWSSAAMTAIRTYMAKGNSPFKVMVRVTNGVKIKDIFVYNGCALSALQHSIFSRENQDERFELFGDEDDSVKTGVIKPPIARESSAKLLQVAFASFEHHIVDILQ